MLGDENIRRLMKLSRTCGYAILAAVELASTEAGTVVASRKLAAAGDIPERFLLQILRNMVNAGLLRSTRGVIGGYSLAKDLSSISLLDIVEAVEGPIRLELPKSGGKATPLSTGIAKATAAVRRELAAVKLSQLAAK